MAEPFLSEIRIMSFNFAPKGWALCNGQLMPINQNQALFSLLGTTYGGDGRVNFGLPDLRARAPIHVGAGFTLGERGGEDAHTLTQQEMPVHTHFVAASSVFSGGNNSPVGRFLGGAADAYASPADPSKYTTLRPGTITNAGGGQAHTNDQPYLGLTFSIALQGIFPSPN
jgi:microcystin-dependent protein